MTATTEPQVAAGSKIEAAGAFFTFAAATDINGTAWTAITTAATAYVTLTPSGTAGSQIMSASWTETAPVWSTSKHGWYTTAASNIRVVAGCTKTDETTWTDKFILANKSDGVLLHKGSIKADGDITGGGDITGDGDLTLKTGTADSAINLAGGVKLYWVDVTDAIRVNKKFYVDNGHVLRGAKWTNSLVGSAQTGGNIWVETQAFMANIGDKMSVSGAVYVGGKVFTISYIEEVSGTVSRAHGILEDTGQSSIDFTAGSVLTHNICMSW